MIFMLVFSENNITLSVFLTNILIYVTDIFVYGHSFLLFC